MNVNYLICLKKIIFTFFFFFCRERKESPFQLKNTTCHVRVTADSTFHYLQGGKRQNVESELVMIFDEVNKILGLADFDFDGEPDGFSLTVQDIIVKESDNNTATGYDAKFDALSLSKVFEDFKNKRQGACISLLFVSIPMESNLIFTTYGGKKKNDGVCFFLHQSAIFRGIAASAINL